MIPRERIIPDHTAVRVALWRALHVELDAKPSVFSDEIGLRLVDPDCHWRERGDMHPQGTRGYRASIVGRARLIEDLLDEKVRSGVLQYVILGAGLDTLAQRRQDLFPKLKVFEIDEPRTQDWKKRRLADLGIVTSSSLSFVPVDFESGESWVQKLKQSGFQMEEPCYLTSTGVSMYLTREANRETLENIKEFAPGSILAMTFMLPPDLVPEEERGPYKMVMERTVAAGTPFLSLFQPSEIIQMAKEVGFKKIEHISRNEIVKRYFTGRSDGLVPSYGEEFLIVTT